MNEKINASSFSLFDLYLNDIGWTTNPLSTHEATTGLTRKKFKQIWET